MKNSLLFLIAWMFCLQVVAQQPQWEVVSPANVELAHPQLGIDEVLEVRFSIRDDMGNSIAFSSSEAQVRLEQADEEAMLLLRLPVQVESNALTLRIPIQDLQTNSLALLHKPLSPGTRLWVALEGFDCPGLTDRGAALQWNSQTKFAFQVR